MTSAVRKRGRTLFEDSQRLAILVVPLLGRRWAWVWVAVVSHRLSPSRVPKRVQRQTSPKSRRLLRREKIGNRCSQLWSVCLPRAFHDVLAHKVGCTTLKASRIPSMSFWLPKCHRTRSGPFGSETAQGSMGRTFSRSASGFEGGGMSESGEGTLLESTRYTRQQSAALWKRCTDARSCRLPSQCTSSAFSLVVLSSRSPPPPVAVTVGSGRGGVKGRWTYWRRALRVVTEKVGAGAGISSRIRA